MGDSNNYMQKVRKTLRVQNNNQELCIYSKVTEINLLQRNSEKVRKSWKRKINKRFKRT